MITYFKLIYLGMEERFPGMDRKNRKAFAVESMGEF